MRALLYILLLIGCIDATTTQVEQTRDYHNDYTYDQEGYYLTEEDVLVPLDGTTSVQMTNDLDVLAFMPGKGTATVIAKSSELAKPSWVFGAFKSAAKWTNQLKSRGWTAEQITEAMQKGQQIVAKNKVNPANSATRYVHPQTGRSVIIDNVTHEVLQVGGDGFIW